MTSDLLANRLPVRTVEKTKFKFDPGKGLIEWSNGAKQTYELVVDGLVREQKIFSYTDIRSFPQVDQVSDLHCVEGWSVHDLRWGGFRFSTILDRVELKDGVTHVVFHSFGTTESSPQGQSHYLESFPLSELLDPKREILLVLRLGSGFLPEDHGAPLRLIAPYDLAYKSIKFIAGIEFVKGAKAGWWTLANPRYPIEARVPQQRLRVKKGA